jgi:hypothetical protein
MKLYLVLLLTALCAFVSGCATTTTSTAPTDKQTVIANAVEDTLSIGLVPVLTKNPDYVPVARSLAVALASFSGETLALSDIEAALAKTKLAPDDARTVAALINAAWDTYARRYAQQVSASVRPDVKLFLGAVESGINRAISSLPKAS